MRVYLAAPLFTQVERTWNRSLAAAVTKYLPTVQFILPQDFRTAGRYNDSRHYGALFRQCVDSIDISDVLLAVMDGADVDSGAAWEMGYAYAKGKPVLGVRTDYRPGAEQGVNIMCARSCRTVAREFSFQEDVTILARSVARRLRKLTAGDI